MAKLAKPVALVALVAALAAPAMAQSSGAHPSFDGVWTNASSTKLERSAAYKDLVVPKAEADAAEQRAIAAARAGGAPSDPNAGAPKDANSTAGYNSFWTDPGISLMKVRGEARASYIMDPADGKIPFRDRAKSLALPIREGVEYRSGKGAYEGPEDLPLRQSWLRSSIGLRARCQPVECRPGWCFRLRHRRHGPLVRRAWRPQVHQSPNVEHQPSVPPPCEQNPAFNRFRFLG